MKVAVPRLNVCFKNIPEIGHPFCKRILDMLGMGSVFPNVANKCCSCLLAKVKKQLNLIISCAQLLFFLLFFPIFFIIVQQNCSLHCHGTEIFGNDLLTNIGDFSWYLGSRPVSAVFTHCLTWIYSSLTLLWQITGFSSEFSFSFLSSLPSLPRSKCSSFFWGLFSVCCRSAFQLVLSHLSICLKKWGFSWPALVFF